MLEAPGRAPTTHAATRVPAHLLLAVGGTQGRAELTLSSCLLGFLFGFCCQGQSSL